MPGNVLPLVNEVTGWRWLLASVLRGWCRTLRVEAPMVLIGAEFTRAWKLNSWDRF